MQEKRFSKDSVKRMYNRYIRDRQGTFTRISDPMEQAPAACPPPPCSDGPSENDASFLRRLLRKFGMEQVDTGDLLLLLILFLLFSEGAEKDEELMITLGLLLIL